MRWRRTVKLPRHDDDPKVASRAAADAEVEADDIDAMLDAIDERRRARGARDIGEEIADELERASWDEQP